MARTASRKSFWKYWRKASGGLLVLATLALLIGCQGVSANNSQPSPGALSSNPSALTFGDITVGHNQSLSATLSNTGGSSLTISQIGISSSAFGVSMSTLPLTLGPGTNATISITFTPTAAGNATGILTVTSNASNPTLTISLSGTGTSTAGQLTVSPSTLSDGNVVVGASGTASGTLSATGASVTITGASSSNAAFVLSGISLPLTIPAGQSAPFTVTFSPTTTGSASATLTFTSNAQPSTTTATVTGNGTTAAVGQLSVSPTTFAVGNVLVGSSGTAPGTLTASAASVTITGASSNNAAFAVTGISLPLTIAAGQSEPFTVTFSPSTSGSASATLTFTSNAQPTTTTVTLTGNGTIAAGQLSVSPTTIAVGNVVVGTSGTASGTLSVTSSSVTITGASTNNTAFVVSGISLPLIIPAGQSAPFTITFSPTTTGSASATLTFTSNAQPSTTTATLTGDGTPPPTHSVDLSWNASTSPNISGYNIYRAVYTTSCGSFSKINSLLNTGTLYTDSNVTDGTSYCYAATAVDTSNQESGYSNIASNVQIPPP